MLPDIGWTELFIIIVVAVIVIGPKELPDTLRMLGRMLGKIRRAADDFRRQFDDTIREAGGEDLKRELDELQYNNPLNDIKNSIEDAARDASATLDTPTSINTANGNPATDSPNKDVQPKAPEAGTLEDTTPPNQNKQQSAH
jgi:sec-independent protein translocase protein TatB